MADQGNPSSVFDTIRENERRINDLEEEITKLQKELKYHEENCQPKIKELEEEKESLKKENKTLREKIGKLEKSNTDHEKRIKEFELSEDELIIRQLCSSVQENILRIVLDKYYNKIQNKSTKYIEEFIRRQIKGKKEQEKAKSRWENLKKDIGWDSFLIIQLQTVKDKGNDNAHPTLTVEKIDVAKINLEEKEELSEDMVKAVDQLKNMWKQTNRKLGTRSAESRDPGSRLRNPTRRQRQGTNTSMTAGGLPDIPTRA